MSSSGLGPYASRSWGQSVKELCKVAVSSVVNAVDPKEEDVYEDASGTIAEVVVEKENVITELVDQVRISGPKKKKVTMPNRRVATW